MQDSDLLGDSLGDDRDESSASPSPTPSHHKWSQEQAGDDGDVGDGKMPRHSQPPGNCPALVPVALDDERWNDPRYVASMEDAAYAQDDGYALAERAALREEGM
jgi:hypothetical protein